MTIYQSHEGPGALDKQAKTLVKDEADAIAHKDGAYEKLMFDVQNVQGVEHRKELLALVSKLDRQGKGQTVIAMKDGQLEIEPAFAKKSFQDKVDHFDLDKEAKRAADLIHSDKTHSPVGMLTLGGDLLAAESKGGRKETLQLVDKINEQLQKMGDHRVLVTSPDPDGNLRIGIFLNKEQLLTPPTHGVPMDRT